MRRRVPLSAFLLAAALPAVAASDSECSRFALRGLLPGMSARDVGKVMGGRGDEIRVEQGETGAVSVVTYHGWPSPVTILYDRVVGRGDGRVAELRMELPDRIDRAPRELLAVLDRLGSPASGRENLETGLDEGPTAWADRACNVLVVARREQESWWEASRRLSRLAVRPLDAACRAAEPADLPWEQLCAAPAAPVEVATPTPPAEPPPVEAPVPVTASADGSPEIATTRPELIQESAIPPRYPETFRRNRVPARVRLLLTVEPDGTVGDVRVLDVDPPSRGFERAAIQAARRWRYRPATRGGAPVQDNATVNVVFE